MTEEPVFLTVEDILAIHERMIREFGGDSGVRDDGLLKAAVRMPAARFGGRFLHEGLPAMAATYLFHLCKNHPFVDGNKRTALAAAEVFLLLNGSELTATDEELEKLTLAVAGGRIAKEDVIAFLRRHVAPEQE